MDFSQIDKSMIVPHPESKYYLCGPVEWQTLVISELNKLGVTQERIRTEKFGSEMAK